MTTRYLAALTIVAIAGLAMTGMIGTAHAGDFTVSNGNATYSNPPPPPPPQRHQRPNAVAAVRG